MPSVTERLDALEKRHADTHDQVLGLRKEFDEQNAKDLSGTVRALQTTVQELKAKVESEWNWVKNGAQAVNIDPTLFFKFDPSFIKLDETGLYILGHPVLDLKTLRERTVVPLLHKLTPDLAQRLFRRFRDWVSPAHENDPDRALPPLREQIGDARRRLAALEGSVRGAGSRANVAHNHIAGLRNSVQALRQRLIGVERLARNARTAAGQANRRITGVQGPARGAGPRTRAPAAAQAGRPAAGARGGGAAALAEARRTQRALNDLIAALRSTHPESRRFRREMAEIQRSLR